MRSIARASSFVTVSLVAACSGSSTRGSLSTSSASDSGPDSGEGGMPVSCAAWATHEAAQCGSAPASAAMEECLQGASEYPPEGCGAEWEAYVECAATATYSCDGGPSGCDAQQTGYTSCETRFGVTTACLRVPSQDSKCSAPTGPPLFSFECQAAVPAGCQALPPTTGATIACCTAFAPM
jgi:hypothetical protein